MGIHMKKVAIIGGGIIGLSSAYYLMKAGHTVTIFDDSQLTDNCSTGNAGMIVPSHIIPLAAPGMISKGIRWMFDSKSPFYVKPRLNGGLIRWGMKFYSHSTAGNVEKAIPVLKEISLLSKSLYQKLAAGNEFDFGYQERGLLMLYQTKETEKEEKEAAHVSNQNGIMAHMLSLSEIQKMESVRVTARGGVYFPGDAHLIPQLLITNLVEYLKSNGVVIESSTRIEEFITDSKSIKSIEVDDEQKIFDEYVIATGAWSGQFNSKLDLDLPMQGGKGYSFNVKNLKPNINIPTLLLEGRVAVTPMGDSLRFGGTMEINGTDRSINMNRVKGIVETIPKYYPELKVEVPHQNNVWRGLRPCSPDGLPYIGRSRRFSNLTIATGHSMMGLSLGPATGKLVSELISEKNTSMNLHAFSPYRFS
jgi:D-amino-acid dehydrogenase